MAMPTIWTEGSRYVLIRFNDEGSKCPNYFVADNSRLNQWLSDEMAEDFIEEYNLKETDMDWALTAEQKKKIREKQGSMLPLQDIEFRHKVRRYATELKKK